MLDVRPLEDGSGLVVEEELADPVGLDLGELLDREAHGLALGVSIREGLREPGDEASEGRERLAGIIRRSEKRGRFRRGMGAMFHMGALRESRSRAS